MVVHLWVDEEEKVGDPKEGEQDEGRSDCSLDLRKVPLLYLN